MVLPYMVAHAKDDQEKLYYMDQLASDILQTFFKQVMYAEFEQEIHEKVEKGDMFINTLPASLWRMLFQAR